MMIRSLSISSLRGGLACGLAYRVLDELDVLDVVLRRDEPPHQCTVRGLFKHFLAHTIRHLRWEKVLCDMPCAIRSSAMGSMEALVLPRHSSTVRVPLSV